MKVESIVGPQVCSDGSATNPRLGTTGELIVSNLHGRYFEQSLRGNLFHACTPIGGVALLGSGVTVGFALTNPVGSNKYVSLVRVNYGLISGTYTLGTIMHGVNTNPIATAVAGTAITPLPGLIGSGTQPNARVFATATLPAAPTPLYPFAIKNASTTASFNNITDDIDGRIVLIPGTTWSMFVIGADTTPLEMIAVSWEEVAM